MKTGNGPKEIGSAGSGFFGIAPNGETWIFDGSKGGARHVFDRTLQFVRTDPPAEFKASQSGFITTNSEIVFAATISSREHAGLPLHVADRSGAILRSFGRDDPTFSQRMPRDSFALMMLRQVEPAPGQTFWSNNPSGFLLERWTLDGQRMYRVEHAMDGWYADATHELLRLKAPDYNARPRLPLTYVKESSDPTLAWFIYAVRVSKEPIDLDSPEPTKGVDIVVEAIDIKAGVVLAVRRFPDTNIRPVWSAPDRIAVVIPYSREFTSFRISRLVLARTP
jgi:hypothetical protein